MSHLSPPPVAAAEADVQRIVSADFEWLGEGYARRFNRVLRFDSGHPPIEITLEHWPDKLGSPPSWPDRWINVKTLEAAKAPRMKRQWATVRDSRCLGRPCLRVHSVAVRAAAGGGTRTAGYRFTCAEWDYRGCPPEACEPNDNYDSALAKERRKAGWKVKG